MRVALLNPNWSFEGSIYFGCREPHLPLELGYAQALLLAAGHEVEIIDGQLFDLSLDQIRARLVALKPEMTVLSTAPSYLFWRCPPPELRVPQSLAQAVRELAGTLVAIGPHGSTTPRPTLRKLGVDAVVLGESEEVLARLAATERGDWSRIEHLAYRTDDGAVVINGGPAAVDLQRLPPLAWPQSFIRRHAHQHHRFDAPPQGPGAELETTRGCPYHCTFCNKENFRDSYRKRPLQTVLAELDRLIGQGIEYVYFIDEIFLPDRDLLEALAQRPIHFGVQLRIDNWPEPMLERLGLAGCVSIEAGVESLSETGRSLLAKRCKATTEELTARLVFAKRHVAFVQANLIDGGFDAPADEPERVERWRAELAAEGVWANQPVPMFPYPGSPDYRLRWGLPDDQAWERAHAHYLSRFGAFSDLQAARPVPLPELEAEPAHG